MPKKRSRLQPQSPYWYEDLPGPTASLDSTDSKATPDIGDDLRRMDAHCLELSRISSINRGAGLLLGGGMLIGMASAADFIVAIATDVFLEEPVMSSLFIFGLLALVTIIVHAIKKEVRTPRDLPVRFYRDTGRVVALEYVTKLNPFAKWEVVQKELDWNHVEAEIGKISGYRRAASYGLLLAACEPETTKVTERIILKSDAALPATLHRMWDFLRCYMANGTVGLKAKPRPVDVSLARCLLYYYPVLDFTSEGRERREKLHIVEWVAIAVLCIPLFWLLLPVSFCEYVALKLAPEPKWPDIRDSGSSATW